MNNSSSPLRLFQGFGVELEYMIITKADLNIAPICDQILFEVSGEYATDVACGPLAWSNELVMHVIELKTNGPAKNLRDLPQLFQNDIVKINKILNSHDACLLSTGAHPFMDPTSQTKIWPHENNLIYKTYNEIFNCQGHGWANLQSTHLNLPFANDDEFVRLHSAIRLLLPILPALSASTPILDGKLTGLLDSRLEYYCVNQKKIPSISGHIIPEAITSISEYQDKILQRIYADISPFDPQQVLQEEWLNSRGAIPRFDRSAIEIRIIDIQECPMADLAIIAFITASLQLMTDEYWLTLTEQLAFHEKNLLPIFLAVIHKGQAAIIEDENYLRAFGFLKNKFCTVRELLQHILNTLLKNNKIETCWLSTLHLILSQGNLSERIITALNNDISEKAIISIYKKLVECLQNGNLFSTNSLQNHYQLRTCEL